VTVLYLLGYLFAIGMLRLGADGVGLRVAADPTRRLFQQTFGSFTYEPIALVQLGLVTYQFSLNTVIGLVVGLLVGVNVAVSAFAWRQPSACGVGTSSAGLLAGIPALLSGAACCAPVIVLLIGIQVTGALLVVFEAVSLLALVVVAGRSRTARHARSGLTQNSESEIRISLSSVGPASPRPSVLLVVM
jgi:hypothetical protein